MVSARSIARRARRKPRLILLSAAIVLAGSISAFAVLEAVQAPQRTETAAATVAPAAESAVLGPVTGAATVLGKDETRLDPAEAAAESVAESEPELAEAPDDAEPAAEVSDLATASIRRPADPAIAAVARMMADGVEPVQKVELGQVPVAESEAEVLALEATLLEQDASDAFEVSAETLPAQEEEETASIPEPQPEPELEQEEVAAAEEAGIAGEEQDESSLPSGFTEAKVTASVNLRSGPSNDAQVIRVLPTNAVVQAESSCVHFCEVTHEGTKGYIYKTYLER